MLIIALSFIIGLALLIWSADRFIIGAVGLANYLHLPPIVIGAVIVGFGTSAPELLISGVAAWQGNSGLAIGNAVGSNIANISLILGVTALLTPLVVTKQTFRKEFPLLIVATLFVWILIQDGELTFLDGSLLLSGLILALFYIAKSSSNESLDCPSPDQACSLTSSIFWTLIGLAFLLFSSHLLVSASVDIAKILGISDVIIGLTIIAIGTSLPELAASVTGALKHHTDLAIGNIVGSNIFNSLGVIGIPGLIHSYTVPSEILSRDFLIMTGLTLLLIVLSFITRNKQGMERICGSIFLLCFIGYQTTLYIQTVNS